MKLNIQNKMQTFEAIQELSNTNHEIKFEEPFEDQIDY